MEEHNNKYLINIYERYTDLKKSNKQEFDNNDLWKIFEYYSCIKLSEEYDKIFYEYDDIDPTFKEENNMSRNDTGIDCCDLDNTIVQCKLRKTSLTWKECSTFFGSQVMFNIELNKRIIRWDNLIITRNDDCTLSENLLERYNFKLFIDRPYNKVELINFCENLLINKPEYQVINNNFILRDYQIEAINIIKDYNKNVIINLPTGTGKNIVIIHSFKDNKKYLILVPRIILMEQLKDEIIKHNPKLKSKIQLIGNNNINFNENKLINICIFNSVHLIEKYCNTFEKIYVDEAHHINKPAIYCDEDDEEEINDLINDSDNEEEDEEINNLINDIDEEDNESKDDSEDELVNVKNYTKIIKSLTKYNNNVYLSATIDKIDDFIYYSKDIRTMIDLKYLCDYTIHVPIFNEDPSNKNICHYLLKNYRNVIIYCNTQKEGKEVCKLMNKLFSDCCEYVDCHTSKKKRNDIIERFKNGKIGFIVNVRILVEGFDAPITKSVCFLHLPRSRTTLIQIIGRALRLHDLKTIANVILPFSSKEDEKNICNFLRIMAQNDSRIKTSFQNKKLGGYINIENTEEDNNDEEDEDEEMNEIEFKYNMIYNSLGILKNGEEIWMNKLENVKKYIDINNKRPSKHDKDKDIKILGIWISHQQQNYKNKEHIMKNEEIYNKWTEFINDSKYIKYFQSNEDSWYDSLNQVIQYIDINNKRPLTRDKDKDIKILGKWIGSQQQNYKNKEHIMKNEEIYNKWTEFINDSKYIKYFQSNEDSWYDSLNQVIQYIDINNKRPSDCDKDKNIKILGKWIGTQQQNYKNNEFIMKNEEIYNKLTEFINDSKYIKYFQSNEDSWYDSLNQVIQYIDINNKRPSMTDKNKDIKILGQWIGSQQQNYKNKERIMKNEEIYNKWTEFINDSKYIKYFQSNEDSWYDSLNQVIQYIDINNKRPLTRDKDKDKDIKILGKWISYQQQNYKNKKQIMKNEEIYNKWTEFINNLKYNKYFSKQ
jgi:superfamily II DNA or RNA helicase